MYGAPPVAIGQLSVPDRNPAGAAPGGVPVPDEAGAGSAVGVPGPVDVDGDAGAAVREGVVPALGAAPVDAAPVDAAPVDEGCAALPQAASAASETAMPAGASSLVYLRVREPPRRRCGFNGRRQPS